MHDRFHTPPAFGASDPKDYPKGFKPGDPGFIEALTREAGIPYDDSAAGGRLMDAAAIQQLIPQLYALVGQLEAAAPGRSFAPDGHLLGSIGEVIAASRYGLTLTTASTKGIDAHTADGRSVEIKATAGRTVALRGLTPAAELLVVLQISTDGAAVEVYNGPAAPVWAAIAHKRMGSNGQRQISLRRLQELQAQVPAEGAVEGAWARTKR